MVDNQNLIEEIEKWRIELEVSTKYIHFALLDVFIEFETFLEDSFIKYTLNKESKDNFSPTLKINFESREQLDGLLKCNQPYINYLKKIKEVKKYIFDLTPRHLNNNFTKGTPQQTKQ